mmetsp:Transcript_9658/g.32326  ORF Transcript_9658/g.32326 Transcript_9658/m.32326 type:complete len:857 (-) Transcript_9658:1299-3869(-)
MPWSQGNPLWNDPGSPWRDSELNAASGTVPGLLQEEGTDSGAADLDSSEFTQRAMSNDPFQVSSRGLDLSWGQLLPSQPSLSLHQLGGLGNAGGPLVYGSFGVSQDDKETSSLIHILGSDLFHGALDEDIEGKSPSLDEMNDINSGTIALSGTTLTNAKLKDLNGLPHVPLPQKLLNPNVKDDSRTSASKSESLKIPVSTQVRNDVQATDIFGKFDRGIFQVNESMLSGMSELPNGDVVSEGYVVCGDVNRGLGSSDKDSLAVLNGKLLEKEPRMLDHKPGPRQNDRKHISAKEGRHNRVDDASKEFKEKGTDSNQIEIAKDPSVDSKTADTEAGTSQPAEVDPPVAGIEDSNLQCLNEKQQDKSDASSVIETISNPADDEQGFNEFSSVKGISKKKRLKPRKQKEDPGFTPASEGASVDDAADSLPPTWSKQQGTVLQSEEQAHTFTEHPTSTSIPKIVKHQESRAHAKDVKDGKDLKGQRVVQSSCPSVKKQKASVHKKQHHQPQQQKKTKVVVSSDEEEEIAPSGLNQFRQNFLSWLAALFKPGYRRRNKARNTKRLNIFGFSKYWNILEIVVMIPLILIAWSVLVRLHNYERDSECHGVREIVRLECVRKVGVDCRILATYVRTFCYIAEVLPGHVTFRFLWNFVWSSNSSRTTKPSAVQPRSSWWSDPFYWSRSRAPPDTPMVSCRLLPLQHFCVVGGHGHYERLRWHLDTVLEILQLERSGGSYSKDKRCSGEECDSLLSSRWSLGVKRYQESYSFVCVQQFGEGAEFDGEMCACRKGYVVLGGMCRKVKRCDDSESGRSANNGKLAIEGSKRDKKRISSTNQGKCNSKTKKKSGKSRRMKELRRNSVVL